MTNTSIPVPCGKCPNCLRRRVSGWSFRLMQEEKHASSAWFLTLTYSEKNVPRSKNGFKTLDKTDVQKFMKRLRKSVSVEYPDVYIKYYLVGEYGGQTSRPHYHLILFNCPKLCYVEAAWNLGAIHYGEVSGASVGYTLKYMSKPPRFPKHRNDDRLMEFSLMSKGLGKSYLSEKVIRYHKTDPFNRAVLNIEGGKKIAMPRYYKEKIYEDKEQRKAIGLYQKKGMEYRTAKYMKRNPNYERDKVEVDKEAFRKMAVNAKKRDKL